MKTVPNCRQTLNQAIASIDELIDSRAFKLELASLLLNTWLSTDDHSPIETAQRLLSDVCAQQRALLTPEQRYERHLAEAQRQYRVDHGD
jgi:hypothetical protein